ncbi:MAG: hypothetical protein A4S09_05290 [Proteobacteria bacterium SG_bin7]|nr:MAG: hypothetical protein A4S09_05290 [Proteobacteria bacterium SG_bin7]
MVSRVNTFKEKAISVYNQYHHWQDPAFFIGGFLFDMVMTGRIDETFGIIQQGTYLLLIAIFTSLDWYDQIQPFTFKNRLGQAWSYRRGFIHFLLGSLLNCYAIFYFKSASLLTSFAFMFVLAAIVVANELPKFKSYGAAMKFGMLSLCSTSFLAYLVPIFYGRIGIVPFFMALILSLGFQFLIYNYLRKKLSNHFSAEVNIYNHPVFQTVMAPAIATLLIFTGMYILKMLPPVPLSAQYLGVYHSLEKENGKFKLGYTRPSYYFWQNGDQSFKARPGDKIFIFTRLFSPAKFKDQVNVRFEFLNAKDKWEYRDSIPMTIEGGRDEGFRGYVFKSNYQPGSWRVRLMTNDNREIRRIYFSIEVTLTEETTEYKFELQ